MSQTRRDFLIRLGAAGAVITTSGFLAACGDSAATVASACEGYADLTPEELQVRQTFQYVDRSSDAAKNCANCLQYTEAAGEGACGGCKLFAGPVIAKGYCTAWVAQPTA